MALHAAEEESIEALKMWWEENYRMLVSVVVAVAVGWGGWTFWQNSSTGATNAASDMYEEILELAIIVEPGVEISAENADRIALLAASLKADYSRTVYARYGALFAAQQAVNRGDLEVAEQELQWLVDNNSGGLFQEVDETLTLTANLRLGRVILARGDAERALELVNRVDPGSLEGEFAELRGDIYLSQGRTVDAHDSYLAAQQAGSTSQFLRMKLEELAGDI